jgi:glucokinase
VDVLNPEVIVIGALAVRLGDLVLGPARQVLAREALPDAVRVCRVLPAGLGERIGDVACLCAAIVAVGKHA